MHDWLEPGKKIDLFITDSNTKSVENDKVTVLRRKRQLDEWYAIAF